MAVVAIVLLVRFVDANSTPKAQAPTQSPKGAAETLHEAEIITAQDQAPHVVRLASATPVAALSRAISAYMRHQVALEAIPGPLLSTSCFPVGHGTGGHLAFRCSALAADTSYPFAAVVDRAAGTVTYCKQDPAPAGGGGRRLPLSRRCLA